MIQGNAQSRAVRYRQHAVFVQLPLLFDEVINKRRTGEVFHHVRVSACGREMQISCQSQCCVPSVRNEANTILFGHPSNLALLADAADLRHIWLHNIERTALEPWNEGLSPSQNLTTRNGQR